MHRRPADGVDARLSWRRLAATLLLVCAPFGSAPGAAQPGKVPEGKEGSVPPRDGLPVFLQRALVEEGRGHESALQVLIRRCEAMEEGGALSPAETDRLRRELVRLRLKQLKLEAAYQDAADLLWLRFGVGRKDLERLGNAAVLPVTRHFRRFEELLEAHETALAQLERLGAPGEARRLRAALIDLGTASDLVKGTRAGKDFPQRWAVWEKLSTDEMEQRLDRSRRERAGLWDSRGKAESGGGAWREEDRRRLELLEAELRVADLEAALRRYTAAKGPADRDGRRATLFEEVKRAFRVVLRDSLWERFEELNTTWPALPPASVRTVDLVRSERERAEELVDSLAKGPAAKAAARQKLRKVRTLAQSYRLHQDLFKLALVQQQTVLDRFEMPPAPGGPRPPTEATAARGLGSAAKSLAEARSGLLRTWIDYQIARLDLYSEVKLSPPGSAR